MKEKKLKTLQSDSVEEEFEKIFQKMMDETLGSDDLPDDSDPADDTDSDDDDFMSDSADFMSDDDDFDSDDEDSADDDTTEPDLDDAMTQLKAIAKRSGWKPGERILPFAVSMSLLDDEAGSEGFRDAPATVRIVTKDDVLPSPDRFKCYVYTHDYYPMCSTDDECTVHREDNSLTYEMACDRIWMPGLYVLLVRDAGGDDSLVRMEFLVDDCLNVILDEASYAPVCGADDVLTSCTVRSRYWDSLSVLPGFRQMRKKILENDRFSVLNEVRKELNVKPLNGCYNFIFCTRNGDLASSDIDDFRLQIGILHPLEYVDCSTLYDAACNNPYEHLGELVYSLSGKVVCLSHLGALLTTGGKTIVKRILDEVRKQHPAAPLWLCGTMQEVKALLDQFPSIKEFFTAESWIVQEPYTDFELVQAFFRELEKEHLQPTDEVKDLVTQTIIRGYSQGSLVSWSVKDIRRVITDDIRPRYVRRMMGHLDFETIPPLSPSDVDVSVFAPTADTFEQCMGELTAMVGLDDVKQGIATMANNTRFFIERRRRGLPTSGQVAYHAIFTGNPGTGKTTVARQLGRIYHSLGLLSRGDVIVADRTRLVGRYIGETEENMKAVLEEARGNVLFIDEAYNLYDGSSDRKDFGARVIDSLLTVLSQPDPDMLIVFAGYEKEMDAMLNTNPGLMGRFPYKYRFSDYDAGQLMEIAVRLFERDAYILTDEARSLLEKTIALTLSQVTRNFGNARWMEQYIRNGIIPAMADRLAATGSDDYRHVEADDIRKAYEKFNPKAVELKPRRKVGFSA